MVDRHPGVARAIVDAVHEVAVYGYDHRLLLKRGPRETRDDLSRAVDVITALTGVAPTWWRQTASRYAAQDSLGPHGGAGWPRQ
jgi:peptidoglycan/xylan/chitin deacetylase (PgdA/CDA1 family)